MQYLVVGFCDMMFDGMGMSMPQSEGKRLRPLAVAMAARSAYLPDVVTLRQGGGPALDVPTWYALWAPKGVPEGVVGRLGGQVRAAFQHPAVSRMRGWQRTGPISRPR